MILAVCFKLKQLKTQPEKKFRVRHIPDDNEYILNFLDVKPLSLGNSIPFYCIISRAVTTLPRSLRRRKLFCIKLSSFVRL